MLTNEATCAVSAGWKLATLISSLRRYGSHLRSERGVEVVGLVLLVALLGKLSARERGVEEGALQTLDTILRSHLRWSAGWKRYGSHGVLASFSKPSARERGVEDKRVGQM